MAELAACCLLVALLGWIPVRVRVCQIEQADARVIARRRRLRAEYRRALR
jgi:hypothetical protein